MSTETPRLDGDPEVTEPDDNNPDENDPRTLADRHSPRNGTTAGRNTTHHGGGTGSASNADALRRYEAAPASAKRGHK